MMRVIVHEQKSLALVFDLEPAAGVLEFGQRRGDLLEWNFQFAGERNHPERVAHVVPTRHVEDGFTELFTASINTKARGEIAEVDIGAAIIRLLSKSERDRLRMPGTDP